MEEFEVRAVASPEEKSMQEVEESLIAATDKGEVVVDKVEEIPAEKEQKEVVENEPVVKELTDSDFISYLETKHGKKIDSIEDLLTPREEKQVLPEDITAYMKYKEETGRGLNDFLRVNEDIENLSDDEKLVRYYKLTKKGLNDNDIADIIAEDFGFDKEEDELSDINKKKRAKRQEIFKANEFLSEQKSKYSAPLESKGLESKESGEELKAYREYIENAKTNQEASNKKGEWFEKKTDELFTKDFKGFDFKIGEDKSITYTPSDIEKTKDSQKNIANFYGKHLDENGMMKDAVGYHKSLAMAMDPDGLAKFFYEQGVSDSVSSTAANFKNSNLGKRKKPEVSSGEKPIVRAVESNSGGGLKMRRRTK